MSDPKSIRLWTTGARSLARVWVCGQCGSKVYCGRLTARPAYRCLCGKADWRQLGRPASSGILH
jgi:hypothetical protein